MLPKKRTGKGRRKIEIKKIEGVNSRQVTFSKRRNGLFHKVGELCVLTGAEAVILVQSPGDRLFAFGNPDVDSVIDKYIGVGSYMNSPENNVLADEVNVNVDSGCVGGIYNKQYLEISKELEVERNKSRNLNFESNEKIGENLFWWEKSFEDLEEEELEKYVKSMEELMSNVKRKSDEMMATTSSVFEWNSNNVELDHQVNPETNEVVSDSVCVNEWEMLNNCDLDFANGGGEFPGDYSDILEVLGDFGTSNADSNILEVLGYFDTDKVDANGFSIGAGEDLIF